MLTARNMTADPPPKTPAKTLKLQHLWADLSNFGFSDMSACDDYFMEPQSQAAQPQQ